MNRKSWCAFVKSLSCREAYTIPILIFLMGGLCIVIGGLY